MVRTLRVLTIISAVLVGCGKDNAKPSTPLGPAPKVTEIMPSEVTPRGLRIGQIAGEGLDTKKSVAVYFGETRSPRAAVVSKSKIQVEIPAGKDGSDVDVRVEIDGYQPVTLPGKLKYRDDAEPPAPPGGAEALAPQDNAAPEQSVAPLGSAAH